MAVHAHTEPPAGYPAERETDVVLRDGATIHVRPVTSDDEDALARFLGALSLRARSFRFFSGGSDPGRMAKFCTTADYRNTYGVVAVSGDEIVAHGMYARVDDAAVEVAFAIADSLQRHGLGTVLLAHLAEAAAESGYSEFRAEVLMENRLMLAVFRESGFPVTFSAGSGVVTVRSPLALDQAALDAFEARDHSAAAAAVTHVLRPASVAVIGASRRRDSVGGAIFHNIVDAGFSGTAYPVNPSASSVQGVKAYGSVAEIPDPVELAVIAVPAAHVLPVARECGDAGVAALVVVSAGFGEAGEAGRRRQQELLSICRQTGMRLVGPNCLGVLTTDPAVSLNATFARRMPPAGPLALMSQSGALGLAVIDQAAERGLGLASFVSAGNKADVSANDLIEFWLDDPHVGVIALYLESFGNTRRFTRSAPRVARVKPIVAVKSGRTRAGVRAASSHTGAALAASDMTVDALLQQAGVIRADTLGELLDVCSLLGTQPLPKGPRVAVLTNSGGPGILCTDALEAAGMCLAKLSPAVTDRLKRMLPAAASVANPVDMLATADGALYAHALRALSGDDSVDAVIVIYTPTGLDDPADVLEGIAEGADALDGQFPIAAVALTPRSAGGLVRGKSSETPLYAFPENAVQSLAHAWRHSNWRKRPAGSVPDFADVRPDQAAAVIAAALGEEEEWLAAERTESLLASYGITLIESRRVASAAAAGRAAQELGGSVALKATSPGLLHKTEAGAVRLGLRGQAETTRAANSLRHGLEGAGHVVNGFVVQRMAAAAPEILVGVLNDAVFGPVVVCGAGGTAVELLKDTAARITPLTDVDAHELVTSLKTFPLLDGWRGAPVAAVPSLEEMLLRVSALVDAHPEIAELDLNPVLVGPDRAVAVDARVRVHPAPSERPWPSLGAAPPSSGRRRWDVALPG
jgi:acetyl coenzyme A synthetase (ADP forming)-like protein